MDTDIELYDQTSFECSKIITQRYSTSFSFGIEALAKKFHAPIYGIYGFVRFADEIVDTFHHLDKRKLLKEFRIDTERAIADGISTNPVLHSFQLVVRKFHIDQQVIDAFLDSMEMDIDHKAYNESDYRKYIYGSAECVGLMCLRVFVEGDSIAYEKLKKPAMKLGSAYQKVNFLRDMKSDYDQRGRVYFPGVDYRNFSENDKVTIERDIEKDFDDSLVGIEGLPDGAKSGVKLAYLYYRMLFNKIKSLPAREILSRRVRISNLKKLTMLLLEKYLYLLLDFLIISIPLAMSFEHRINYASKWYALFPSVFLTGLIFLLWDIWFTRIGAWKFNTRYVTGITFLELPIEEYLFFLTVPYSCVFIYESLNYCIPFGAKLLNSFAKPFFYLAVPLLLLTAVSCKDKIYTLVNSLLGALAISVHFYFFQDLLFGKFFLALLVHLVPFFICNGILTGGLTEEPVVIYDNRKNTNIRIWTIPIEDAVYSMTLLLTNLSFFEAFQSFGRA